MGTYLCMIALDEPDWQCLALDLGVYDLFLRCSTLVRTISSVLFSKSSNALEIFRAERTVSSDLFSCNLGSSVI